MDYEAHRYKGCQRKVRYRSPAKVRHAVIMASNHGDYDMTSYWCEFCGGWHLGKLPGQRAPLTLILRPGDHLP